MLIIFQMAEAKRSQPSPVPAKAAKRPKKERRIEGILESEVLKLRIPDHLDFGLDILVCGINPGVWSAARGHHYAGPGNHFWPCLSHSGLLPAHTTLSYSNDMDCLHHHIGFTNSVLRTTRGSNDLSKSVPLHNSSCHMLTASCCQGRACIGRQAVTSCPHPLQT